MIQVSTLGWGESAGRDGEASWLVIPPAPVDCGGLLARSGRASLLLNRILVGTGVRDLLVQDRFLVRAFVPKSPYPLAVTNSGISFSPTSARSGSMNKRRRRL